MQRKGKRTGRVKKEGEEEEARGRVDKEGEDEEAGEEVIMIRNQSKKQHTRGKLRQ